MRHLKLSSFSSDVNIPVLGIGTWGIGGLTERDYSADRKCVKAIRTAIKLGMSHIDTAEIYSQGHAEELVGEAIKGFERKKLFITTKVWRSNLSYKNVIAAAKASLKRMGIKYIDLYLIHWPNPRIPLKETIKAMDFLVEKKLVRAIGVSNFSVKLMEEAQSYTNNKIVANQIEYNLLVKPEKGLLEYCRNNNIIVIAYQPLAGGKLAKPGFKILDELAEKYCKTRAQIAINWLISQQGVITIPKSVNPEHIKENVGALSFELSRDDKIALSRYFNNLSNFRDFMKKSVNKAKLLVSDLFPEQAIKLSYLYNKLKSLV
jgi:diketogulonate reductase-like aldo/keto reductase